MMDLISLVRTRVLRHWHGLPLPTLAADTSLDFQPWCQFNPYTCQWNAVSPGEEALAPSNQSGPEGPVPSPTTDGSKLVIVTWNVDSASPAPEMRISDLISHIESLDSPRVDVIFLQEVSCPALAGLLAVPWLRQGWYLSDIDASRWGIQSFGNITLLSKSRFGFDSDDKLSPGPVWKVRYPSRFERYALCCDVILPASSGLGPSASSSVVENDDRRIRLINVHLNSLPVRPSLRPRQIASAASFLHSAGCRGLVAGDFNPVLPEDDGLIGANGLTDVWSELHPHEPGFTWVIDGQGPFPPSRMDRIAVLGLNAEDIKVIPPGLSAPGSRYGLERPIPWSDHSGLICSFAL